jgi:sRNA-binding regulator protein Hfq
MLDVTIGISNGLQITGCHEQLDLYVLPLEDNCIVFENLTVS